MNMGRRSIFSVSGVSFGVSAGVAVKKKMVQETSRVLSAPKNVIRSFQARLLEAKINSFKKKQDLNIETGRYIIRAAENKEDLKSVFSLRHEIFVEDLKRESLVLNYDFDRYDLMGDHLLIFDQKTEQVVGTYRLISSKDSDIFYSESEFEIDEFKNQPGHKLELGRACIHRDHRNGVTLHLIWKGLAAYAEKVNARYLFGCSSIFTLNQEILQEILSSLSFDERGMAYAVSPLAKYSFQRDFQLEPKDIELSKNTKTFFPSLLGSYLKAGAKIYGQPACDLDFQCADVFTVLDRKNMNSKYVAKYFSHPYFETSSQKSVISC